MSSEERSDDERGVARGAPVEDAYTVTGRVLAAIGKRRAEQRARMSEPLDDEAETLLVDGAGILFHELGRTEDDLRIDDPGLQGRILEAVGVLVAALERSSLGRRG